MKKKNFILVLIIAVFSVISLHFIYRETPWESKFYKLHRTEDYYFSNFITQIQVSPNYRSINQNNLISIDNINIRLPNIKKVMLKDIYRMSLIEIRNLNKLKHLKEIIIAYENFESYKNESYIPEKFLVELNYISQKNNVKISKCKFSPTFYGDFGDKDYSYYNNEFPKLKRLLDEKK